MTRSLFRWISVAVACSCLASPAARAAQAMDTHTSYGTMTLQALHTLGGTTVRCDGLLAGSTPSSAQALCARVPASMFGYFRMGVHGRLYEYLARGTLHVARAWASVGGVLRVVYDVQGGTLSVERERVGGVLYAIFEFQPASGFASAGSGTPTAATPPTR